MNDRSNPTHAIDPVLADESIGALRRRITTLEEENVQLMNRMARSPVHSWTRDRRSIHRLISLIDPVTDLIAEYDRRIMAADGDEGLDLIESTAEEDRTFRSFKKLMVWCPSVRKILQCSTELTLACHELKKGADGARGDDANTLKSSVTTWLNGQQQPPCPLLLVDDKQGRGFNNDVTGGLLCPVDYNWLDAPTRNALREYHPNYAVTANMWPSFLYAKGRYNPKSPFNGLFKGELLVRAFRCIFTSPTSSCQDINIDNDAAELQGPARRQRTHCNVAGLLKMRSVQPRAIAYAAIQLRFALSSCTFWTVKDDNFDYEIFYHNIVDWFELPAQATRSREIEKLLHWWNRLIFGHRYASTLESQDVTVLSVALSMA